MPRHSQRYIVCICRLAGDTNGDAEVEIQVPYVTGATMQTVATFCGLPAPKSNSCSDLLKEVTVAELGELMKAANYLDIETLLAAVADRLAAIGTRILDMEPWLDPVAELFGVGPVADERAAYGAVMKDLESQELVPLELPPPPLARSPPFLFICKRTAACNALLV